MHAYAATKVSGWQDRPFGIGSNIAPNIDQLSKMAFGNGVYNNDATRNPVKLSVNDLKVTPSDVYVFESSILAASSSVHSNAFTSVLDRD
jgi:hypothetical protein